MSQYLKASFFKYDKQLFALAEVKGSESKFTKVANGGFRLNNKIDGYIAIFLDSELEPHVKRRVFHKLIKCKKAYKGAIA